ncbi:MAG: TetR family transcriptional regulator [Massilia sp.]
MARRTKEEAQATHDGILDAAEQLFVKQGVARTTLQDIATVAGVTRGAIYWHFEDKGAMFNAMMERAKMPLESAMQLLDTPDHAAPLDALCEAIMCVFRLTVDDPQARRVFEIATLKLEYVDEMSGVRERRKQNQAQWMVRAEALVRAAVARGQARPQADPAAVALGLWALIDGLLRAWLLAPDAFDLVEMGRRVLDTHLGSLRLAPQG